MSSINCDKCGKPIIDSPKGYITECRHHPFSSHDVGLLMIEESVRILKQMEDNKAAQFNVRPRKP